MWYKFSNNENEPGKLQIKKVQICWYDWERNGDAFDEDWILPEKTNTETLKKIGTYLTYVGGNNTRVFVHMEDESVYELSMNELPKEILGARNNFNVGRTLIHGSQLIEAWKSDQMSLDKAYAESENLNRQGFFTLVDCVDIQNDLYQVTVLQKV